MKEQRTASWFPDRRLAEAFLLGAWACVGTEAPPSSPEEIRGLWYVALTRGADEASTLTEHLIEGSEEWEHGPRWSIDPTTIEEISKALKHDYDSDTDHGTPIADAEEWIAEDERRAAEDERRAAA